MRVQRSRGQSPCTWKILEAAATLCAAGPKPTLERALILESCGLDRKIEDDTNDDMIRYFISEVYAYSRQIKLMSNDSAWQMIAENMVSDGK